MTVFHFEILHRSKKSRARVGRIHTPHGIIDTPNFVAVGTNGTVKALDNALLHDIGLQLRKEQLTSFLLNDLKLPVGAMALHAQSILQELEISADSRDAARSILSDARQLMRLILNLLDISRSDGGARDRDELIAGKLKLEVRQQPAKIAKEHALARNLVSQVVVSAVVDEGDQLNRP